jgi:hypothetical protein
VGGFGPESEAKLIKPRTKSGGRGTAIISRTPSDIEAELYPPQ